MLYLSATHPEWFAPYRDLAVTELPTRLPMDLATAAILLPGTSDAAIERLCDRLAETPSDWGTLSLLAGANDPTGMEVLADVTRTHGSTEWLNRMGVHVGDSLPAIWRFTPHRYAIVVPARDAESADGLVGAPIADVAVDPQGLITWHYLSLRPAAVEGVPAWPSEYVHLVSPRTFWFTLHCNVLPDGRYTEPEVDDEGEPFDSGMHEAEADPLPRTTAALHRYDESLVYRNGARPLDAVRCGRRRRSTRRHLPQPGLSRLWRPHVPCRDSEDGHPGVWRGLSLWVRLRGLPAGSRYRDELELTSACLRHTAGRLREFIPLQRVAGLETDVHAERERVRRDVGPTGEFHGSDSSDSFSVHKEPVARVDGPSADPPDEYRQRTTSEIEDVIDNNLPVAHLPEGVAASSGLAPESALRLLNQVSSLELSETALHCLGRQVAVPGQEPDASRRAGDRRQSEDVAAEPTESRRLSVRPVVHGCQ